MNEIKSKNGAMTARELVVALLNDGDLDCPVYISSLGSCSPVRAVKGGDAIYIRTHTNEDIDKLRARGEL